jgi:hypothetical protein
MRGERDCASYCRNLQDSGLASLIFRLKAEATAGWAG